MKTRHPGDRSRRNPPPSPSGATPIPSKGFGRDGRFPARVDERSNTTPKSVSGKAQGGTRPCANGTHESTCSRLPRKAAQRINVPGIDPPTRGGGCTAPSASRWRKLDRGRSGRWSRGPRSPKSLTFLPGGSAKEDTDYRISALKGTSSGPTEIALSIEGHAQDSAKFWGPIHLLAPHLLNDNYEAVPAASTVTVSLGRIALVLLTGILLLGAALPITSGEARFRAVAHHPGAGTLPPLGRYPSVLHLRPMGHLAGR